MASTSPARIDDDLYASAKVAGSVQSRSASQQVAHWARIGREIEASAAISHREIAEALAGARSYDSLDPKEQAVVRAEWSARMDERREVLDFAAAFASEGRTWVELDDDGKVVERSTTATPARRVATTTKSAGVEKVLRRRSGSKQPSAGKSTKVKKDAAAKRARASD